eukprot:TRINITY_DN9852_c0_g2_i2.p2 TRINITY_DN9852_c0_g2~~TRINITY_DN9852_c0_g2_i2.p2  ORF type:complete len:176 (+),score=63.22 TRINITY_DN9852_c0_g2_i2:70-597(+)
MGRRKAAAPAAAAEPEPAAEATWECDECQNENPASSQVCEACDAERPEGAVEESGRSLFKVGVVVSAERIEGKEKLQAIEVDIGAGSPVAVVTNAPNVSEGSRLVVATVGAVIEDKGEEITIKKTVVGGRPSAGMVCNCPMLGWTGGDDRCAALLPDTFKPGDVPPERRPRMDGK